MKFNSLLAASFSAATVVASSNVGGNLKHLPRSFNPRSSSPQPGSGPHPNPLRRAGSASSTVEDSTNWSGAIIQGNGLDYARGTFVVPTPRTPPGGDMETFYSSAAWVGIDGDEDVCSGGLIQTGVLLSIQGGVPAYQAWYEWWPDEYIEYIDDLPITAGDTVRMSVYAYTPTSGSILIENLSHNTHYQQNFTGMTNQLCFKSAEWVVEDWSEGDAYVPLDNFTTITFTDAYSNQGGISNALVWDMVQDNTLLSSCAINSVSSVTCKYV